VRDESCAGGIFEPAVLGFKIPRSVLSRILRFLRFGNTNSKALGSWLENNGHVDAATSLREGLEETLTVLTLGLPIFPPTAAANAIAVSQARGLSCGTAALNQVQQPVGHLPLSASAAPVADLVARSAPVTDP